MTVPECSNEKLIPVRIPATMCHCDEWQWVGCSFCGSSEYAIHYYVPYPWTTLCVVQCGSCGHFFSNPVPTKEALRRYYGKDYALSPERDYPPSIDESLEKGSPWEWRHEEFTYKLELLRRNSTLAGPLLEVGPGWGGLLYHARLMGIQELHALDVSVRVLEYVGREIGCETHEGFLSEVGLEPDSFNTIVANNYLEHSLSPCEDLGSFHAMLRSGGVLLLAVPNFDSFLSRQQRAYWRAIRGGNHYHHFTPHFLSEKVREKGFLVKHLFTTSKFYHWPAELEFELSAHFNGRPREGKAADMERQLLGEETIVIASKER